VDLKAAFDSVYRPALWKILQVLGIPEKITRLIAALHTDTTSCVSVSGTVGEPFRTDSGVRQGCIMAPDLFDAAMDWVMERTTHRAMNGISVGEESFSDLDFADDVAMLAELIDLLESALTILQEEAAPLGLEVNWRKTKIQSHSDFLSTPDCVVVDGRAVECVPEFTYLGSLIHESGRSIHDLRRRMAITRQAMMDLNKNVWSSRLSLEVKIKLYNACILSIFLYGSETWTLTREEEKKVDALDQWCLRRICNIKWNDFITNEEVRRRTNQQPLTTCLKKRRLSLFGHVARLPPNNDTRRALAMVVPPQWKRPRGRPRDTWLSCISRDLRNISIPVAMDMAEDRIFWREVVAMSCNAPGGHAS
jgi:Reverse transcriptase (RNA-dependent DNA polymerase)